MQFGIIDPIVATSLSISMLLGVLLAVLYKDYIPAVVSTLVIIMVAITPLYFIGPPMLSYIAWILDISDLGILMGYVPVAISLLTIEVKHMVRQLNAKLKQ